MKLVVDARSLLPVQPGLGPTGVGRWTAGVVGALAEVSPDWSIELVLVHKDGSIDPTPFGPNVSFRAVRISDRWQRRLSVAGLFPKIDHFVGRPDAVLGPMFVTWRSAGAELPVLHDLTHIRYPKFVSPRNLSFMRLMLPRTLRHARRVITVSEAMRSEICSYYDIKPDRVDVIPNGYDPRVVSDAADAEPPPGIPKEFLLFVGTIEPRKNLLGTLEAYEIARQRENLPPLVIVGGKGWRDTSIIEALGRVPDGSVISTGYVEDRVLFTLYHRALALIFPTFYEGFGLPVLEAMACGCPVVTARVGGVPEVAGDAVLYVNPGDPADIASGISRIIGDEALRSELIERGRARVDRFTWVASGNALKNACLRAIEPG